MMVVYVLHFDPPYPRDNRGSVRHYVGWCLGDPEVRLAQHTSPLVRAAKEAGCVITIGATFNGSRVDERKLKRQRHPERVCEVCRG